MQLTFSLPDLPPSVNNMYKNARRGRVKTDDYKAWRDHMMWLCPRVNRAISEDVAVDHVFRRPDKRRRDVGNLEKAVSDLIVTASILSDDSQIVDIRLRWGDPDGGAV